MKRAVGEGVFCAVNPNVSWIVLHKGTTVG